RANSRSSTRSIGSAAGLRRVFGLHSRGRPSRAQPRSVSMSNRRFLLMAFGALIMSGAVLNSHAAYSAQAPAARAAIEETAADPATEATPDSAAPSLTCGATLCHANHAEA